MTDDKKYSPQPIPIRRELDKTSVDSDEIDKKISTSTVFAELTVASKLISPNKTITPQAISEPADEIRAKFYAMRKIATEQLPHTADRSVVFYKQAEFMSDFEDDYPYQEHFSAYYPSYQLMGYGQLRTYFSWRSKVRNLIITRTSLSYAILYIYELLNNIGVENPREGLEKLFAFWREFRRYNDRLDDYVLSWIKDYHVYYQTEKSFIDFASLNDLECHYPTVFVYLPNIKYSLAVYNELSSYKITQSIFYSEENKILVDGCFFFLITKILKIFESKGDRFENLFLHRYDDSNLFIPFRRALFYPTAKQVDREIVFSPVERYNCKNNRIDYDSVAISKPGQQLLGYIIKEMEASLRKLTKFKHRVKPVKNDCDYRLRNILADHGIELPEFIENITREYYRIYTHKKVEVDVTNLKKIRNDALHIQNRLTVPEETISEKPIIVKENTTQPTAGFAGFILSLNDVELDAVKLILACKDIKALATDNNLMQEVLIDNINQKATDTIGDTLMEMDEAPIIFDEYISKLKEVL